MSSSSIFIILAIIVYLVGMILIGYRHSKGTKNSSDFYLGGRKLGPIVAAMSTEASDMSAYLLMGVPGLALFCGVAEAGWTAIGLALGTYLNWLLVARRLRSYSARVDAITVPDFLARRFRDNTKLIETVGALVIIIFFVPYTASGFVACGKLFNSMFGIDYHIALTFGAMVILLYTFMGGFMAVCTTDFIQGTLMLIALLVIPIVVYLGLNGNMDAILASTGVEALSFKNIMQEGGQPITAVSIISSLAWGLGYFGMPHILVRFMAIKNEEELKKSKIVGIVWVFLSLLFACVIGVVGRAYLAPRILGVEGEVSTENVFIEMIKKMFTEQYALPFIAGIFLCAILAAIMSTAD